MPCGVSCLVSVFFVISMVYMMMATSYSGIIQNYYNQLTPELKTVYRNIVDERRRNYFFGYILGFLLAIFVIIYNTRFRKIPLSTTSMVCLVVSISFFVNYFYYVLSPKSDWMLDHIKTPEQTKAWLEMYKGMQLYYHTGLVLGLIGVGSFAYAFRCRL